MYGFEERVALVTGGASGIGREVVQQLADGGAHVIVADRAESRDELAAAIRSQGGQASALDVDVSDETSVMAMLDAIEQDQGRLDILVHSAGVGIEKPFLETSLAEWQRVVDIDLTGTFLCCQAAARLMLKNNYGRIVTLASTAGVRGGFRRAAYGAAKGGVIALTKVMAVELGPLGVTVNALAPGAIETELVAKMHSPETRRIYNNGIPLARYGTPGETAAAAVFLASEQAAYVNGHVLAVDGGFLGAGLMDPQEQAAKAQTGD